MPVYPTIITLDGEHVFGYENAYSFGAGCAGFAHFYLSTQPGLEGTASGVPINDSIINHKAGRFWWERYGPE